MRRFYAYQRLPANHPRAASVGKMASLLVRSWSLAEEGGGGGGDGDGDGDGDGGGVVAVSGVVLKRTR